MSSKEGLVQVLSVVMEGLPSTMCLVPSDWQYPQHGNLTTFRVFPTLWGISTGVHELSQNKQLHRLQAPGAPGLHDPLVTSPMAQESHVSMP
jgi:hypothetical protein